MEWAINLFVRDMPRLSVDIDLTYLPFDNQKTALAEIIEALRRIKTRIEKAIPACKIAIVPQGDGREAKPICQRLATQIKIEGTFYRHASWTSLVRSKKNSGGL